MLRAVRRMELNGHPLQNKAKRSLEADTGAAQGSNLQPHIFPESDYLVPSAHEPQ